MLPSACRYWPWAGALCGAPSSGARFSTAPRGALARQLPADGGSGRRKLPADGRTLADFLGGGPARQQQMQRGPPPAPAAAAAAAAATAAAASAHRAEVLAGRSLWVETYGCQMNKADSEVVLSVLQGAGCVPAASADAADVVLLNTCAIREKAEDKVLHRLGYFKNSKRRSISRGEPPKPVVGVLGCMAERLKKQLLESDRMVDVVAGPDAYRDLPRLLAGAGAAAGSDGVAASASQQGGMMNVQLSLEETYADVAPVRQAGAVSAFVSITRGCNNLCSFCIVPYVRGRERSRDPESILRDIDGLAAAGVKEVTLLGQNVNSYCYLGGEVGGMSKAGAESFRAYAEGFTSVYKPRREGVTFAKLLKSAAEQHPEVRFRFTSPHPKDFGDDVLDVIAKHPNVARMLHLPAQSGSTENLQRMRRGYSREAYDALVERARARIPGLALSSDFIAGFCGETETDHELTVDLIERTGYSSAFLFAYSRRDKTHAARHYEDDVPADVKQRRLREIIAAHRLNEHRLRAEEVGRVHLAMVEGNAKREGELYARSCTARGLRLPAEAEVPISLEALRGNGDAAASNGARRPLRVGDFVACLVLDDRMLARPLAVTTISAFAAATGNRPFMEAHNHSPL